MGIKNFNNILKEYVSTEIKEYNLNHYSNKIIAIDTSLILYKYVSAMRNSGKDLTDKNNNSTSHIFAILQNINLFISKKVKPLYVFDGPAPEIKKITLDKRKRIKETAKEKQKECKSKEEEIKYFKRSLVITKQQYNEVKLVLTILGIPYIQADGEADVICSYLVRDKIAYAAYSEDMDFLTFGCPILLKKQGTKIQEIKLEPILKDLKLSYNSFINLTILLGCDYASTIKGIGYKTAYKLIKEYSTIEEFINKNTKYKIPPKYNYKEVINYYNNPKYKIYSNEVIFNLPDLNKLKTLLIKKNFQEKIVNNYINKFNKNLQFHK
tara:strand:+ start:774 stop:1745 length:972 start_codon:yes stop_codon:yes gene_type:complete